MLHFGDSVYEADLRRDVGLETETRHLTRLVAADKVPSRRAFWTERSQRLLARLGDLLVDVGCELQSRYAVESGTPLG